MPKMLDGLEAPERVRSRTAARHAVEADHAGGHMRFDVTVVEPVARVLLAPADAEGLGGPDGLRVAIAAVRRAPAMPVDMEGVVLGAHGHHVPLNGMTDIRGEHGGV